MQGSHRANHHQLRASRRGKIAMDAGALTGARVNLNLQLATKKISRTRQVVLFGMIGGFLIVSVLVAANFTHLVKARKMLSADYTDLEEVVYYRNAVKKLENTKRTLEKI